MLKVVKFYINFVKGVAIHWETARNTRIQYGYDLISEGVTIKTYMCGKKIEVTIPRYEIDKDAAAAVFRYLEIFDKKVESTRKITGLNNKYGIHKHYANVVCIDETNYFDTDSIIERYPKEDIKVLMDLLEIRRRYMMSPSIKKVIFNNPATIVFWTDGTKTIVKVGENETFDKEKGLAMAISKKALGNNGRYYNEFKKFLEE